MAFQEMFAQLRQRAGLSQSEVAERLFVTRQAVSRWERGVSHT
ncbi:MAG TPA: helix-turn-helix domain-containing protein [Candidatus Oscillibacter pullicola]|nr:helix-turn-helix domain-containing protein [Candidatus Oscillibacter pullicola]